MSDPASRARALDYGSAGRVGILLPSSNRTAEAQLRAMLPASIGLAVTRLKLVGSSEEALLGMSQRVEEAAELVADAGVDLVVFHCTAVSTYSKALELSILRRIEGAAKVPAVATSIALVQSLQALRARRIVMLSPYGAAINDRESDYFCGWGFEVLSSGGRACGTAAEMARISPADWLAMSCSQAAGGADAIVLSCTTTRAAEAAQAIEEATGIPVVTSNTAVAWACMRALNCREVSTRAFGRLLRDPWAIYFKET